MTSTTSPPPNSIVVAMVPCVADEALLLKLIANPNEVPFVRYFISTFYNTTEDPCAHATDVYDHFTRYCHHIGYVVFSKRLFTNTVKFNLGIHYSEKRMFCLRRK